MDNGERKIRDDDVRLGRQEDIDGKRIKRYRPELLVSKSFRPQL